MTSYLTPPQATQQDNEKQWTLRTFEPQNRPTKNREATRKSGALTTLLGDQTATVSFLLQRHLNGVATQPFFGED